MTAVTKTFLDFDKEEAWLNEMADHGQLLSRKRFRYHFRPIEPGRAVIRVDFRDRKMSPAEFEDYLTLFADAGWQHLDGSRSGGAQYFASFDAEPDADIFSDPESKAARYRRAIASTSLVLLPLLVVVTILTSRGVFFTPPGEWYLTPGLWEMEGLEFLGHFLFESLFVLLRVGVPLLVLVASGVLLVSMLVRYRLSRLSRPPRL